MPGDGQHGAGAAQTVNPSKYPTFFTQGINECYLASVSNGENFGLGQSRTSVTVQNLSEESGVIYLVVGDSGGFAEGQFAAIEPGAAKTFTAQQLGVPAGKTAAVAVMGYDKASSQAGKFDPEDGIAIGCVAKQSVAGANLPDTTSADRAVSGYNATSGREVGFFNALYLPIVQTNCGPGGCWNTIIRVANVGPFDNAAVTLRFFESDNGQGSLDTSFQLQKYLGQGELWSIDASEYVRDGWVGSVHVMSDDSVVAIADRYKVGTSMWITNTASNATSETTFQAETGPLHMPYVLYASDVRLDYNGWNTGISVANTVDEDNTVNIQYFGSDGNAPQAQTQRLATHGMTYFYNPSSPAEESCAQPVNQIATCDFVGGAVILSEAPVAVVIDGVKYAGNDEAVGQAYSYSATGNVYQVQSLPLVQKGSPATGMGATSGITFLNPNGTGTYVTAEWKNPSGFPASNMGDSVVWIPAYATGFIYSMTQQNLPNGFIGSARITSQEPIAATSANVDYAVNGDGTAIYNLYNPCGLYRQIGDCEYTPEPEPLATKTFDVRPLAADAWICVYPATGGQSKPVAPTDDCLPQRVIEKGANDGGQGEVETWYAPGPGGWYDIHLNWNVGRIEASRAEAGLLEGPIWVTYDPETRRITPHGVPEGWMVQINFAASGTYENPTRLPGNNACTDVNGLGLFGQSPDYFMYFVDITGGITLTLAQAELIGDLGEVLMTYSVGAVTFPGEYDDLVCGQLEQGTSRWETPAEMQQRLKTLVPPVQVDGTGQASIDLPEGCYFFGVSAAGYATQYSDEECLASGEVVPNNFDLSLLAPRGSFTKMFCTAVNNNGQCGRTVWMGPGNAPVFTVWLLDADGDIVERQSSNTGRYVFLDLPYGVYSLVWTTDPAGTFPVGAEAEVIVVDGHELKFNLWNPVPPA